MKFIFEDIDNIKMLKTAIISAFVKALYDLSKMCDNE